MSLNGEKSKAHEQKLLYIYNDNMNVCIKNMENSLSFIEVFLEVSTRR